MEITIVVFALLIAFGIFKDRKSTTKIDSCHKRIESTIICRQKICSIKPRGNDYGRKESKSESC